MSLRRRFTTWTSAAAAALVGVLLVASPAPAAGEVEVEINGLADSIRAGDRFDDFRAVITNTSGAAISGVFTVITVSLPGAPPDAIYVQRAGGGGLPAQATGEGSVSFTDPAPFDLGRGGGNARRRIDFVIAFGQSAPDGEAVITVAAYAGGELLGSTSASMQVRGGTGPTTPPNTDPGIVPTFEAGPSYSIAPLTEVAAAPVGGSTVPKSLYVLGSLLVVIGLMTLVLILRPPGLHHAGAAAQYGSRRPMQWPEHPRPADGSAYPRPAQPGRAGVGGAQPWPGPAAPPPVGAPRPAVATPPGYRSGPPPRDPGPHTGTGRVGGDRGPHTGSTGPVRNPAPDDGRRRYE